MKKLLIAILVLVAITAPAYAFGSYWYEIMYVKVLTAGGGSPSVAGDFVLLDDGASFLVLDDGTSKITMA